MTAIQLSKESLLLPSATIALVESALDRSLPALGAPPETLHRAMRYAVFSSGRRLRPQLLLQVAQACGAAPREMELALRAACAIELVHTASLIHDDLPCFDDAAERRGQPTVHLAFGEPIAVLVGDVLLTQAFDVLADAPRSLAPRALRLVRLLSRATGSSAGLIGGQSLEQEVAKGGAGAAWYSPELIERYHDMKTGVLFGLAAEMAAIIAGSTKANAWAEVGQLFGKGYQLAHDLIEVRRRAAVAGSSAAKKPALGPPNAVLARGEEAVRAQLTALQEGIRSRILALAVAPETLLAFLDKLPEHLPRATDVLEIATSTAAGGPALVDPI